MGSSAYSGRTGGSAAAPLNVSVSLPASISIFAASLSTLTPFPLSHLSFSSPSLNGWDPRALGGRFGEAASQDVLEGVWEGGPEAP